MPEITKLITRMTEIDTERSKLMTGMAEIMILWTEFMTFSYNFKCLK